MEMNREQRRAAERGRDAAAQQQEKKLIEPGTPQDVTSVRAKSQRHGKVTADKWNQ
jgi:hypothetical protein